MNHSPSQSYWVRSLKAKVLVVLSLYSSLVVPLAQAEGYRSLLNSDKDAHSGPSQTSEFIYRNDSEEALIPIYLIGAVARPGLYHVPRSTDVITLLTLAGGPLQEAQIDNILVKNQSGEKLNRQVHYDLSASLHSDEANHLALISNDIVFVNPNKPWISNNLLSTVGLITGLLAIVASGFIIKENFSK